uniref:Putative secreted protein n=1 Tax=Ixodes ricinus TaxID=34613 RepID=A0A6B0V228_IXORI
MKLTCSPASLLSLAVVGTGAGAGAAPKESGSAARDCSIESLRSHEGDARCVAATPLPGAPRTASPPLPTVSLSDSFLRLRFSFWRSHFVRRNPSFLVEGCGPLQGGGVTSGGGRGTGGGATPGGPFSGPALPAVTGVEVEKNGAGAADPAVGVSCSPGSGSSKVTGSGFSEPVWRAWANWRSSASTSRASHCWRNSACTCPTRAWLLSRTRA